jgi:hypothetical protein
MLTFGIKRDKNRIRAAEMKFMRRTTGYPALDYEDDLEIMRKINTKPNYGKKKNYRSYWTNHVLQMYHSGIPFHVLRYQSKGPRSFGRPFKS